MTIIPVLCFGVALIITMKAITQERVFNKHIFQLVESAENEQEKDQSLGNGKIQGFLCFLKMSSHQGLGLKWSTYDCVNILFSLTELKNPITLQYQEKLLRRKKKVADNKTKILSINVEVLKEVEEG